MATPATRKRAKSTIPGVQPPVIADEVTVGNLPALQTRPAVPGHTTTITARPVDEYVSAGGHAWYANYARSMGWSIDDVTADFGDDLYDKMMQDGQVSSLVNVFRAGLLEAGVRILPAISDEEDPDYQQAKDLADWVSWALEQLEQPLSAVLWDMSLAVPYGNRVAELVWHYAPDKDGKQCLLLRAIKPKPRHAVAFVVDTYWNVIGLLGLIPGQATIVQPDLLMADLALIPNFLPREKFFIQTFRMYNCDPRGVSICRPAYNAWWLKIQAWPEYLKYISQFASPSLIGTTPEGAEAATTNADGTPIENPVSPETAMAASLATIKNSTALAFPFGAEVDPIQMAGEGEPFIAFIDLLNREMAKAILNQVLATEESQHQTRAASGTHENILDTLKKLAREDVEFAFRRDVVRLLVLYNKGEKALRLLPKVSLAGVEQHDFAQMATGVAALENAGYLGESQKPGIDEKLGLPARDTEADAAAAQTALDAATAAAANPTATPGERTLDKAAGGPQASGARAVAQTNSAPNNAPSPAGPKAQKGAAA